MDRDTGNLLLIVGGLSLLSLTLNAIGITNIDHNVTWATWAVPVGVTVAGLIARIRGA